MKVRRVVVGFVALVAVAVIALVVWRRQPPAQGGNATAATQPRPAVVPPRPVVRGSVLVNGLRESRAHRDVPLLIEVALRNPYDEPITLRAPSAIALSITQSDGRPVPTAVEVVGEQPMTIEARGGGLFARAVPAGLPPGSYRVRARCAEGAFTSGSPCGTIADAVVEILEGEPSPEERAYAEVQVLARRGDTAGALALIERTMAQNPGAWLWRLWRADALREQGKAAEAAAEYRALMAESVRLQRERGIEDPEIPFWLAQAMAR